MKIILSSLLLLTFSTFAYAALEVRGNPAELRTIIYPAERIVKIAEQVEETAYSDQAIVNLVVSTEEKQLAQAIASNTTQRSNITTQLNEGGISSENIKSSKFSTSPQYGWFGKKPSSYKVINRLAITITTEKQLEYIAAIADSNNTAVMADAVFKHSNKDEFIDNIKKAALDKVMKRKAFYEENLNVKLTPVNIRDTSINNAGTEGAMMLEEIVVTARRSVKNSVSSLVAPVQPKSSFDEITYKANLQVDFIIEPVK